VKEIDRNRKSKTEIGIQTHDIVPETGTETGAKKDRYRKETDRCRKTPEIGTR
jgi:hypothetical protein